MVSHEPPPKPRQVSDLAQAARNLRQKESRREEQFRKSVEAERDRGKLLERRFEEALEKAKEEPPGPPPPRDIDLD